MENNTDSGQATEPKKHPRWKIFGYIIAVGLFCLILFVIISPMIRREHHPVPNLKCQVHLRGLFAGMMMYESEFHCYPTGKGAKFWEALRTLPTPATSIFRDKKDDLFVCPSKGTSPGLGKCDYLGPNYKVSDRLDVMTPLGADEPNNHNQGWVNVLYRDGTIISVEKDNAEWKRVQKYLTK